MSTSYEQYRDKIDTGDAICFSSTQLVGKLIQARSQIGDLCIKSNISFDHNRINHVGTAVRFTEYDNRLFIVEAQGSRGVLSIPLSEKIANYSGNVWHLPLNPAIAGAKFRIAFGVHALSYCGIYYGYLDIVKNLFGRTTPDEKNLFCSEHWWFTMCKGIEEVEGTNKFLESAQRMLKYKSPVPADVPLLGLTVGDRRLK